MSDKVRRTPLAVGYLFVVVGGLVSLLFPPPALDRAFVVDSPLVRNGWAVLAVVGGVVGAYGAWQGRWRIERWAAPLAASGVFGYALIIWTLFFIDTYSRATHAVFVTCVAWMLLDRSRHLARKAKSIRLIASSTEQVAKNVY